MDWSKLQEVISSTVNTLFTTQDLTLEFSHILYVSKKCFEICKRHIEFNVTDFGKSTEEEKASEMSEQNESIRNSLVFKKHLKKIDESFQRYDEEQEDLEKRFRALRNEALPPSLIEKLISMLEAMKNYQPDFILNIRDISLDSWKESLNFEKLLQTERKKYENIIIGLGVKWRNRTELIKEKAAAKIGRLEKELGEVKKRRDEIRERMAAVGEDLKGWIKRKMDFDKDNLEVIKQAGFKGIRDVIRGVKGMEKIKAKFVAQVEALGKEVKAGKLKLSDTNIKMDAFKRRAEIFEENLKEAESLIMYLVENFMHIGDKKNIELYLTEKNYEKIKEAVKSSEKKAESKKEDVMKEEKKAENKKSINRNETDAKGLTQKKENVAQNKSVRVGIKKILNGNDEVYEVPDTKIRDTRASLDSSTNPSQEKNPKSNSLNHLNEALPSETQPKLSKPSKSPPKLQEKQDLLQKTPSSLSEKPELPPKHPKPQEKPESFPKSSKPETLQKSPLKSQESSKNTLEPFKSKPSESSDPLPEEKQFTSIVNSSSKASKFTSKHRRSLDSQPFTGRDPERTKGKSYKSSTNTLKNSLKKVFSSEVLRSADAGEENTNFLSSLQNMDLEELLSLKLYVNGQTKTVKEITLDSIKGALKQPSANLLLEPQVSTQAVQKKQEESTLHELKYKALRLFVLIENYLSVLDSNKYSSMEDLLKQTLKSNAQDDICEFIRNSKDPEFEIQQISVLVNRSTKYELLSKVFQIPKTVAFEWKSDKIHIFNKIRWRNMIMKLRIRDHQFLTELAFKIEVEVRDKRQRSMISDSTTSIIKKDLNNCSMESIALNDVRNGQRRNISMNSKGLNYFLPHIQKTPRVDRSFGSVNHSFIGGEMWVKNNKCI